MTWHSYVYLCNTGPDVNEVIKQPKGGPLISYSLYVGSTIGLVNYSMYLCIWFLILNFIYFMIQLLQKIHGQTPRFYDQCCNLDIKDIGLGSSGALFHNTDLYFMYAGTYFMPTLQICSLDKKHTCFICQRMLNIGYSFPTESWHLTYVKIIHSSFKYILFSRNLYCK